MSSLQKLLCKTYESLVYSFQELFSKAYENIGVLFASIPNFTQFYSEDVNRGMECIRLLNEIIGKRLFHFLLFSIPKNVTYKKGGFIKNKPTEQQGHLDLTTHA